MELTEEQQKIVQCFMRGENIFITGAGGTGKSEIIQYLATLKPVVITATTGCAAVRLGNGRTIHSWSGVGLGNRSVDSIVKKMNPMVKGGWRTTKTLIVDEVSMMSMKLFELLNDLGKRVRQSSLPFGGMQIIFLGDFYQLPPVGDREDPDSQAFCFESREWNNVFNTQIELTKVFRQTDETYSKILLQIRKGIIKKSADQILRTRVGLTYEGAIIPTKLYPTKRRVDEINQNSMDELEGEEHVFTMTSIMRLYGDMEIEYENIKKTLLVDSTLRLKVGAQVMCVINIQNEKTLELCNGSQGVVTGFSLGYPVVQFQNGVQRTMCPHIWESERMPTVGVSQVPLILAWAISIHKSQGATLDMAEVDIGSGIFECGQSYVALSRVKSLNGLYLSSYNPGKIKINRKVKEFYDNI